MGGVTILETERLILRPWHTDDAEFVLDLYSRWEVQRFIGNQPRVIVGMGDAVELIGKWRALDHPVHGIWAVELKTHPGLARPEPSQPGSAKPQLAGTLLLKSIPASGSELPLQPSGDTEIGWHFHPDHWGKGYATETARVVLDHAFARGLPRVVAVTNPANAASQRVCTRIGLSHRGQTDMYYNAVCELFEGMNPGS
ncbi:GNAT family N-acetyltransferase [Arthrobacter sp. FW306-06-A]|uniref:GNAT family N-acetyltransferase n=1 Tax=Arthrobacter sp. FW306-06-A TaxID=2879621 RepID=UPI0023518C52|nr:GNAT family N-acetyltransferase [Arthrobacter sp. FW306-06-A]